MPSSLAQFVYFSQSADLYIYYFYLCLSLLMDSEILSSVLFSVCIFHYPFL